MGVERRSDAVAGPAALVDVEIVYPVPVPLRRSADGALVADWGQIPARVYVAGLAGDGRWTMTACLQAIAAWLSGGRADIDTLPWASLRFTHTTAVRAALARAVSDDRYAPATANKHLAALRGALKAAWRLGMIGTEDYLRAIDLRPVAGSRLPAGRDVEGAELAALLACCRSDDSPAGVRDAAVVALAYLSGTRRAEIVSLHVSDVELVPPAVRVVGKGGKQRLVPLSHRGPVPRGLARAPRVESGAAVLPHQPGRCAADRAVAYGRGCAPAPQAAGARCRGVRHFAPRPAAYLRRRPPRRRRRSPRRSAAPRPRLAGHNVALRPTG